MMMLKQPIIQSNVTYQYSGVKGVFVLLILCSLPFCRKKSDSSWEKTPRAEEVQQFVHFSLSSNGPDSLFLEPIGSASKGKYIGDAQSIQAGFAMDAALADVLNQPVGSSFHSSLMTWSALAPWWDQTTDGVAFKHFNPVFIEWATTFLIPSPNQEVEGKRLQTWYDESFRGTLWTYHSTHVYLTENKLWDQEVTTYRELAKSSEFKPTSYFEQRIQGKFDAFDFPYDNHSFNAANALSFWMRRSMDGTSDECFNAIEAILDVFEPQWRKK